MAEVKVYSVEDIANILKVTPRTVYSYIKSGALHAVKLGKYWRITQKALDTFLTTGTEEARQ